MHSNTQLTQQQQPTSLALDTAKRQEIIGNYISKYSLIANRAPTQSLYMLFEEVLSDMSPERLERGMKNWLRNGDRFPWPSDIREAAEL